MLAHSFDRFYVVTKFILHTVKVIKFSSLNFDNKIECLRDKEKEQTADAKQHALDLITFCRQHIIFWKTK